MKMRKFHLDRVAQWFNMLHSNQEIGSLNPGGYLVRLWDQTFLQGFGCSLVSGPTLALG